MKTTRLLTLILVSLGFLAGGETTTLVVETLTGESNIAHAKSKKKRKARKARRVRRNQLFPKEYRRPIDARPRWQYNTEVYSDVDRELRGPKTFTGYGLDGKTAIDPASDFNPHREQNQNRGFPNGSPW